VLRSQRDFDWGADIQNSGLFAVGDRMEIAWNRRVGIQTWLLDERSKSYVAALKKEERDGLLQKIERIAQDAFPEGVMTVPYETWLWIAKKRT
jgi:hypothetical protein